LRQTVCSGKQAVQGVEAPVFLINDYDVLDVAEFGIRAVFFAKSAGGNQTN